MVQEIKPQGAPSTSQRVKALEKQVRELQGFMGQLAQGVNQTLNDQLGPTVGRLGDLEEIVSVLVEDYGAQEVSDAIEARRQKKLAEDIAKAKDNITKGVEQGYLVPTDTVGDKSLIVGFETNAEGVPVSALPWASILFNQLRPDMKTGFLGAKVGTAVQNGTGAFNITDVYNIDEAAAKKAAAAPAVEAPTPAAEEAVLEPDAVLDPEPPAAA